MASDSPVIAGLGLQRQKRPDSLLFTLKKTGGEIPPQDDNETFWWGNEMELADREAVLSWIPDYSAPSRPGSFRSSAMRDASRG